MTRVVVIAVGHLFEERARELLGDDIILVSPAAPDIVVARLVQLERRPELIVFGEQMPTDHALSIASASRAVADGMALVSDRDDVAERATASGITEIVGTDAGIDELESLFARSRVRAATAGVGRTPHRASLHKTGRIVAVTSPKGGVGKTTIACNLAMGLAALDPRDVVIVDLDLQFGDVGTTLTLDPRRSVADAVSRASARDATIMRMALTEHPRGLFALCAPRSPAEADSIKAIEIGYLLRQLAGQFAYVIVDTAPGLSDHTLTVIENATDLVSITSMDVSGTRGLRKELEVLRELDLLPISHHVVLNMADRSSGMTISDVEKLAGVSIDVVLPRTRAVALATNRGIPVIVDSPRDAASRGVRLLIQRLHGGLTRKNWRAARRKEKVS